MSSKLTILRLDDISILNPDNLKALIIVLCIFKVLVVQLAGAVEYTDCFSAAG